MEKELIKAIKANIKDLQEYYNHVIDEGHNFWYCAETDKEKNRPYFFVQINRSRNMETCSNCNTLLEIKRKVIKLQKLIGAKDQWPLKFHYEPEGKLHTMVSTNRSNGPTFDYLKSQVA